MDTPKLHPNSLANLKPITDSDKAREMQKKSAASRKAGNALRKKMNMTIRDWNKIKKDLDMTNAISSVEFLRFYMLKLMSEEKFLEAAEIAKNLAEFEAPKLARIDQTVTNNDARDLTDEELEAEIAEIRSVK
jgi:predicted acyltransferase (DUF342 family)